MDKIKEKSLQFTRTFGTSKYHRNDENRFPYYPCLGYDQKMRIRLFALGMCVIVAGCGGSGGGGNGSLSGTFSGSWATPSPQLVPPPGDSGIFTLTVDGTSVSGICFNQGKNETGAVSGVLEDGRLSGIVDYPVSKDWTLRPISRNPLRVSASKIEGNIWVDSEEYNRSDRTVHGYIARLDLSRQ